MTPKSSSIMGKLHESPSFWKTIKALPIILATSSLVGCLCPKYTHVKNRHASETAQTLAAQEKQKKILDNLKSVSFYDERTQVSYVIGSLPSDRDTLAVAAKNNIFFAEPNVVTIFTKDEQIVSQLLAAGGQLIAKDVYRYPVVGNTIDKMQELRNTFKDTYVGLSYYVYFDGCTSYNDPLLNPPGNGGQDGPLMDEGWIINGITNPKTDDIDSIAPKASMHLSSNVVVNVIGGGFNQNHAEFIGRSLFNHNYETNSSVVTPTNHEMASTSLIASNNNNSVGGGALRQGNIRNLDIGGEGGGLVTDLYEALDDIALFETNNPTQYQINNFSLQSGNDPIVAAKLDALRRSINVASAGNSGALGLARPARWTNRAISVGGTMSDDSKDRWTGASYGPEMKFAKDAESVLALQADGSYAQVNGTSFAAPLLTADVATIKAQDTSRNQTQIEEVLKDGSRTASAWNQYTGYGWVEADRALNAQVIKHMPTSFPSNIHSYTLVPKYYNGTQTSAEKVYFNNDPAKFAPMTINGQGQSEFFIDFTNPANGLVPGNNKITYQFTAGGCTTKVSKNIFLTAANLPITLLDYNTTVQDNDVKNVVRTASEQNTKDFVLERSRDGVSFMPVGVPVAAAGNSSTIRSYTLMDYNVPAGTWYYRVRQNDLDGRFSYTPINRAIVKGQNTITVYPNPASNMINIKGDATGIEIFNMTGQIVQKEIINNTGVNGGTWISIEKLAVGTYVISIRKRNGQLESQKIQVQR